MKTKTIIALQGPPNRGKSLTIGILFDLMKDNGYEVIMDKKRKTSKDFFVILKKNGVLVGICSYGDEKYLIQDRCNRFIDAGCEIIVCACHTDGPTVDAVRSFRGFSPVFVVKTETTLKFQNQENTRDANKLLEMINSLYGNRTS